MRSLLGRLVLPLICVLLGCGIYVFGGLGTNDPVLCGGKALQQGESCAHMSKDGSRTASYAQQKAANNRVNTIVQFSGIGVAGIGVLAALWALGGWSVQSLRRRDDDIEPDMSRLQITVGPGPA